MVSPPWEADRHLTLEGARTVIGARFPEVDSRTLEHLGSGWEFDTFLTADGWVFRFPRRAWCEAHFESERRVHDLVSRVLPSSTAIPTVELVGQPTEGFPYRFAGHRFIQGVPADTLSPGLEQTLAGELARALHAIHSIPEEEARAAGVAELELDEGRLEWLERGLKHASQLRGLDPAIEPALKWAGKVTLPPPQYEGPLRLIHHDLSPEHLIVDPNTGRLVGILDWTDAILGDPARDFVVLVTLHGWDFAGMALSEYRMPVDEGFWNRLRFMARLLSMIWLANAGVQGSDLVKPTRCVRNVFADHSRSLSV